jgi:hypothetical protein
VILDFGFTILDCCSSRSVIVNPKS